MILSALVSAERYGLEIVDTIQRETGRELSLGGLYTTLARMERKGLVKSRWGDSTDIRRGARRRYYRVTGLGERAFATTRQTLLKALRPAPRMATGWSAP